MVAISTTSGDVVTFCRKQNKKRYNNFIIIKVMNETTASTWTESPCILTE